MGRSKLIKPSLSVVWVIATFVIADGRWEQVRTRGRRNVPAASFIFRARCYFSATASPLFFFFFFCAMCPRSEVVKMVSPISEARPRHYRGFCLSYLRDPGASPGKCFRFPCTRGRNCQVRPGMRRPRPRGFIFFSPTQFAAINMGANNMYTRVPNK